MKPRPHAQYHPALKGTLVKSFQKAVQKQIHSKGQGVPKKTDTGYADKQKNLNPPNKSEINRLKEKFNAAAQILKKASAEYEAGKLKYGPKGPGM